MQLRTLTKKHPDAVSLALVLVLTGCGRREEEPKPAPKPAVSVVSVPGPAAVSARSRADAEPQPDFLDHPPLHLKPPCESASKVAESDDESRCITLTLRCAELDRGEPVWLATSPANARLKLSQGSKGLRVTQAHEVSATVCCKGAGAEAGKGKTKVRLFTDEVAGANFELDCP